MKLRRACKLPALTKMMSFMCHVVIIGMLQMIHLDTVTDGHHPWPGINSILKILKHTGPMHDDDYDVMRKLKVFSGPGNCKDHDHKQGRTRVVGTSPPWRRSYHCIVMHYSYRDDNHGTHQKTGILLGAYWGPGERLLLRWKFNCQSGCVNVPDPKSTAETC